LPQSKTRHCPSLRKTRAVSPAGRQAPARGRARAGAGAHAPAGGGAGPGQRALQPRAGGRVPRGDAGHVPRVTPLDALTV